ncbi:hypothetical protein LWM68_20745 [Niabella sp. W65]|nr:hypothetical protein [Niabella sp. W65]MCH7364975.1 hypothetical protein [Niabella sp. W65]ULT40802.1 hypothetical protein KRR40_39645 [Niabella sp. I65]
MVPGGLRFEMPDIVVNDSLTIELWSKEKKAIQLVIVDVSGLPWVHKLDMGPYKKLTVLLNEFARGLCKVFITDEQNKILAKSYFFAHYSNKNQLYLKQTETYIKPGIALRLRSACMIKTAPRFIL